MAKYITRTTTEKKITVSFFEKESEEVKEAVFDSCIGFSKQTEELEKQVKKAFFKDDNERVFLKVLSVEETEHHYRMLETDFIRMAEEF